MLQSSVLQFIKLEKSLKEISFQKNTGFSLWLKSHLAWKSAEAHDLDWPKLISFYITNKSAKRNAKTKQGIIVSMSERGFLMLLFFTTELYPKFCHWEAQFPQGLILLLHENFFLHYSAPLTLTETSIQ